MQLPNTNLYNGFLTESLFDPLENDTTYFEWHQYHYNQKGQLQSGTYKMMNLPCMTEDYEYDDKGRLKKRYQIPLGTVTIQLNTFTITKNY